MQNFTNSEGELIRGRDCKTIREHYSQHYPEIDTGQQLRSTLRAGPYAWPGGYAIALWCSDGAALCFYCARAELHNILYSIRHGLKDGWRVIGCDVSNSDDRVNCGHCGRWIV